MPLLYACSGNPGKLREFIYTAQHSLAAGFEIEPLPNLCQHTPPAENGATYERNAEIKASYYSSFAKELVFADDSGLEVDALGGAPGIYSARFAGEHASGAQNNALLLDKLIGVRHRAARFITAISLARQGQILQTTLGKAKGEILLEPRGALGFGYDSLFLFPPLGRTFAELEDTEKFEVSARGEAFRRLLVWLSDTRL
jgi:XTP/dITP diphosphohydrolase